MPMMPAFLNAKVIAILAAIVAIFSAFVYTYKSGYNDAEIKYQAMLTEFSKQAEKLTVREEVIKTEIVTEYKDRVHTIKEKEYEIIKVTEHVLAEEAKQCAIGPNFIELHNRAAK